MTVKIAGREINGIIYDLEGTMTSPGADDAIYIPARRQLARILLETQAENAELAAIEIKRTEYEVLAQSVGWHQAFCDLGGDTASYHGVTRNIDRTAGIVFNLQLCQQLELIRSAANLAILTRAMTATTHGICTKLLGNNWKDKFAATISPDSPGCPASKPDHQAFLFVMQQIGTAPEKTAMVGNSMVDDIIPAATLGMLPILIGEETEGPWELCIPRIEDLAAHIEFPT